MLEDQMVVYTDGIQKKLKEEFGEEVTPEFLNLVRAGIAAHEHAFQNYGITKEDYIRWVSLAWDRGVHQRRVYDMEVEGCIDNSLGILLNLSAILSLHGQKEGYLAKKEEQK